MLRITHKIQQLYKKAWPALAVVFLVFTLAPVTAYASGVNEKNLDGSTFAASTHPPCGGKSGIVTAIDIGCVGKGNPIMDMTFAIIRFLSDGVGLVIIGSLVWAGIQYSGSRGDPQATALAVNRIRSTFFALLLFIFAYFIIAYLLPDKFLQ